MEKDAQLRAMTKQLDQIRQIVGGSVDNASPVIDSDAIALWKTSLGNNLAGRIFSFLAQRPNKEFTKEQILLAVGSDRARNNEWGRLKSKRLIIQNGEMFKLNPNL
jgi:hypothetical protein